MQNTDPKAISILALAFVLAWPASALSGVQNAVISLPKRMASSTAYGIGTVHWGAVAYSSRGRAELFVYEVTYGSNNKILICTEASLLPAQKVLFSVSGKQRHPRCLTKWSYVAVTGSTDVIYPGFYDLIRSENWFQVSPGFKENLGCKEIRTVEMLLKVDATQRGSVSDIHGIPGSGSYFSSEDFIKCLRHQGLPLYKVHQGA